MPQSNNPILPTSMRQALQSTVPYVTTPIEVLRGNPEILPHMVIEQAFVGAELCDCIRIVKHLNTGGFGRGWHAVLTSPSGAEMPVFIKTFGTVDTVEVNRDGSATLKRAWESTKLLDFFEEKVNIEASVYMHPWFPAAVDHPGAADARLCHGAVRFPGTAAVPGESVGDIFFVCGELCSGGDLWAYGHMDRAFPEEIVGIPASLPPILIPIRVPSASPSRRPVRTVRCCLRGCCWWFATRPPGHRFDPIAPPCMHAWYPMHAWYVDPSPFSSNACFRQSGCSASLRAASR